MPDEKNKNGHDSKSRSIEEICASTWEQIYRFIYYKVQNREEAEDITQEAYVKAISHIQKGSIQPDKYTGFLKTVALNVLRDLWRKNKRRQRNVNIECIDPLEKSIEDASEASTQRLIIEQALNQLSEEQRTVIDLRILKGYSVVETAKRMDKKEGTIRVMQYRALQNLARILKTN